MSAFRAGVDSWSDPLRTFIDAATMRVERKETTLKLPVIPFWAKWLIAIVVIFAGLFFLAFVVIVGPLFYACQFNGDCV